MNSLFFKGLLAALIGCIASLLSVDGAGVWYWVITILGVVITYFAQNAIIKPVSVFGTIDLVDIIKGILIAIGTAISSYVASLVDVGTVNWPALWSTVGAAALAYLTKNLFSNSRGKIGIEAK